MRRFLVPLLGLSLYACSSKPTGPTFDLSTVQSKVSVGMNEVQVVSSAGVPTRIDIEGATRNLRYDATDRKGYLIVSLKGNVVVDISRRD